MDNKLSSTLRHFLRLSLIALLWASLSGLSYAQDIGLVLRADGEAFAQVVSGLRSDLGDELQLTEKIVSKNTPSDDIEEFMEESKPKVVVLIGNSAINVYSKYQKSTGDRSFPPAVALAALYVDKLVGKMKNATGIRYEIPAVTSLVNIRSLLSQDIKKVGVVYRQWMQDFFDENASYARSEKIELIGYKLPNRDDNMAGKLKSGLKTLLDKNVDAFWIINDNALLNQQAFIKAWLPVLASSDKPVIVGVKSLVASKLNFGSYAIVPDHYALGIQAASMIFDIMDEDWSLDNIDIQQPLSVKKIVNMKVMTKKGISVNKERLQEVDEVIY